MKSPSFPSEKENSVALHPNDQLRRKLADLTSDSSFSSDLSNKFLKSLIKKKSLPVFLSEGTQTEEKLFSGSQELEELKDKNRKLEQTIANFQADIDKLRFENLKLEKTIKTLQESLAIRGQVRFLRKKKIVLSIFSSGGNLKTIESEQYKLSFFSAF